MTDNRLKKVPEQANNAGDTDDLKLHNVLGKFILRFAYKNLEKKDYFTIYDLMNHEPTTKSSLKHIKKLPDKELREKSEKKFRGYLKKRLSVLVANGLIDFDKENFSIISKRGKTIKVHQFRLTSEGEKYISERLEEPPPKKKFLRSRYFKFKWPRYHMAHSEDPDVLDKTLIHPAIFSKIVKKLKKPNSPSIRKNQWIRQYQKLLYEHIQQKQWNLCIDDCISLVREYNKLKCFDISFKFLVSAIYFNWLGNKRYNSWNAAQFGRGAKKFRKGRIKKALIYFKELYMNHLPSETIQSFGVIYDYIADFYAQINNTSKAIEYYILARNLFAHIKNWKAVHNLDQKLEK